MWPFDRLSVREYLRIGPHTVERWSGPVSALALVDRQTLPSTAKPEANDLLPAIRALYPQKPQTAITVLFESAWLPVLLLEAGPALWNSAQVRTLLLHRLQMLYGDRLAVDAGWELRLDYRAGERFALGYGLSLSLKQSLLEVGEVVDLQWAELLPAFAWGLQLLHPARRWPERSGWWVWSEQDRLLIARINANRIVALHTGAAFSEDSAQILHMVAVEGLRAGISVPGDPINAATWSPTLAPLHPTSPLHWLPVVGPLPASIGANIASPAGSASP